MKAFRLEKDGSFYQLVGNHWLHLCNTPANIKALNEAIEWWFKIECADDVFDYEQDELNYLQQK